MCVVWGVQGIMVGPPSTTEETVDNAIREFVSRNRLKVGDQVVITAGTPPGVPGRTNLIMTRIVG
jgi:pyruvate kinase